jgi:hypothetical protein
MTKLINNINDIRDNDYRDLIIKWLAQADTKYHLTLTFNKNVTQEKTRNGLNKFVHHLNNKIYRRAYQNKHKYIRGFAIREFSHEWNSDHYHLMLLNGDGLPEFEDMNRIVSKQEGYFKKSPVWGCVKDATLQDYYNNNGTSGLEKYLTKNVLIHSYSGRKMFDCIGLLGDTTVAFGRLKFSDLDDSVEEFIEKSSSASYSNWQCANTVDINNVSI